LGQPPLNFFVPLAQKKFLLAPSGRKMTLNTEKQECLILMPQPANLKITNATVIVPNTTFAFFSPISQPRILGRERSLLG
jgi:hypothetical protein